MKELITIKDIIKCEQIEDFLEKNGIQIVVKNKTIQNIIEPGNINLGYNLSLGPIKIFVGDREYDRAIKLLKCSIFSDLIETEFETQQTYQSMSYMYSIRSIVLGFLWLLGIGNVIGIGCAVKGLKTEPKKIFSKVALIFNLVMLFLTLYFFISILPKCCIKFHEARGKCK